MKAAAIIILLGVFACVLWYQHNKHAREINSFKHENTELIQQNHKLHNIIDKKYLTVKPKPGI
jgi:hypothetical protein